jgi:hypothetical protein
MTLDAVEKVWQELAMNTLKNLLMKLHGTPVRFCSTVITLHLWYYSVHIVNQHKLRMLFRSLFILKIT